MLEIGPGQGALTRHLAGKVRRLVCVEKDDALVEGLRVQFAFEPSVQIIHADILDVQLASVSADPAALKVIGNIPYNITTPILFNLLERRPRPREIVLLVQREVAERIVAPPGGKTYGALAVGVRTVADAERVLEVGRKAFRPVPDVESAVIRITPHTPPRLEEAEEQAVRRLSRHAFGQRRKQFQRILRDAYGLDAEAISQIERKLGISLQNRPETFAPEQFVALAHELEEIAAHPPGQ
ncbi:16S rRNA (adenine(1518)-N(6)/adenine(1519)-N(6))-dimethyltransferaseRsmA [soil metagenome]